VVGSSVRREASEKLAHKGDPNGLGTRKWKWKSEDEPQVEEPTETYKAWKGKLKLYGARRGPRRGSSISLDTFPLKQPKTPG